VPTDRPRQTITETDEIARALDAAAVRWPEDRDSRARARLLARLVREGHRATSDGLSSGAEDRREAIRAASGALTGVYTDDYLESLRRDWPPRS
jgi:hypothetical protein